MRNSMNLRRRNAEGLHDGGGNTIKQDNRPMKGVEKPLERQGDQQRHALRSGEAEGLRGQLSNYDVKRAQEGERSSERAGVRDEHGVRARLSHPNGLDDF